MDFLNNNNEDFLNTFRFIKAKYSNSIIVFKNGEDGEECYETFLEDADFFIKHCGVHRISKETESSWVAFPKGALEELVKKISRHFNFIIIEPFSSDDEGFQLSLNL